MHSHGHGHGHGHEMIRDMVMEIKDMVMGVVMDMKQEMVMDMEVVTATEKDMEVVMVTDKDMDMKQETDMDTKIQDTTDIMKMKVQQRNKKLVMVMAMPEKKECFLIHCKRMCQFSTM